jgi:hypothetical protein
MWRLDIKARNKPYSARLVDFHLNRGSVVSTLVGSRPGEGVEESL